MLKVKVTMATTYCGCPSEVVNFEYDGDESDFDGDGEISTEILNMISNREFPHYYLDIETEKILNEENMLKVKVTMATTYCGCPSETVEFKYEGTEAEFDVDNIVSAEILDMIFNREFPHYYLDIETEEIPDKEDQED